MSATPDTQPRRWRVKIDPAGPVAAHPNGSAAVWLYGCYFPQTDLSVGEMGARGTGPPTGVEWLDRPGPPAAAGPAAPDSTNPLADDYVRAGTASEYAVLATDLHDLRSRLSPAAARALPVYLRAAAMLMALKRAIVLADLDFDDVVSAVEDLRVDEVARAHLIAMRAAARLNNWPLGECVPDPEDDDETN